MVGQPGAALVEQDQPERAREALVERSQKLRLPAVNEIRHPIGHVDEIHVALTDHLVRDRDAAVVRIPDRFLHGAIFR
jgi:hypothetical protein